MSFSPCPLLFVCVTASACTAELSIGDGTDTDAGSGGPTSKGDSPEDTTAGDSPIPEVPRGCEGMDAQGIDDAQVRISGADCHEEAITAAVRQGGTIVLDCPDAPVVLTRELVIETDTVIDGLGVTVLDGGKATRIISKGPGPSLWLQHITLQNARAPEALGNPEVTQANWFRWAGGAINVQCHDDASRVGGGLYGKGLICRDNATGSATRDPDTGQILDTGTGGCVYSFTCPFHCDECEFSGNHATNGGAIGTLGGKTRLTRSTCTGNVAALDGSTNDNRGYGGCYYQDGTETAPGENDVNYVHFCGNAFADNRADVAGGAVDIFYRQTTRTSIEFVRNLCQANGAKGEGDEFGQGGCLYIYVDPTTKIPWAPDVGPDELVVSANAFVANTAERLGGGAAIYNIWSTSVRFDNNLFATNEVESTDQSRGGGGALGLVGAFFDLEHNTFALNTAHNWSGGVQLGAGGVGLRNNLFFRNAAPVDQGNTNLSDSEHLNWKLDEVDDGQADGFLVFASAGNLYMPSSTASGEPRPSPGAKLRDVDPGLGELVTDDTFPPYLPLKVGSVAVGAGEPLASVPVDMRGHPRDADAPDIGAFEQNDR